MFASSNVNRIDDLRPGVAAATRMLDAVISLDEQLTHQKKAREAEYRAFQRDVFIRSPELEAALAKRAAGGIT